ncbi:hypothetical protein B0F90DRAFT_389811 [Multifurca ochricompacta]|uniref:Protein kinase domain-containing protein n=1 Tax=Multifurca ochricompacta TaxID=376703 RepID=A0AAD4LUK4_9AGAM|nr:hypothetical protein B0F90DRAFT_389811 [Multifurca ochricompacta]
MSSEQPPPPSNASDIFSLSDRVLAEKLQFIKEIGFGNWGSVWLCQPRVSDSVDDTKLAVKLVHRSKTATTAARVRSLWNEMKVVRTFKNDPHPSIVPFHSFIITPSYALITMEYLPELVPVEVPECKAKEWFRSLLSGVEFLHSRGVVHNDIKPANILLSEQKVPVLVDFGFAEKYDLQDAKAFSSNLTYGTPEYLSPERARGLPHDTRKADIWSLGITFFEILIGRTPFEQTEGEPFTTKAALEDYWARTMRGKWLGSWKISTSVEKMLRRMIQPNADLRCTAPEALKDPYWDAPLSISGQNKAAGGSPDKLKTRNVIPSWSARRESKIQRPECERTEKKHEDKENAPVTPPHSKKGPVRQRVLSGTDVIGLAKKRPNVNAHMLTPLRPRENVSALKQRSSRVQDKENDPNQQKATPRKQPSTRSIARKPSALGDRTVQTRNAENTQVGALDRRVPATDRSTGSVRNRMREWELERARLREMERVGESDPQDTEPEPERPAPVRKPSRLRDITPPIPLSPDAQSSPAKPSDPFARSMSAKLFKPVVQDSTAPLTSMSPLPGTDADSPTREPFPRNTPVNESSFSLLKQSLKIPLGKTVDIYKSSIGLIGRRPSVAQSSSPQELSERPSWEKEIMHEANSSLPAVQQAVRNRRVGADSRTDRMTIWLQNVEKVVADARQNFASSKVSLLPPLPIAPGPQTRRLSRDRSQDNLGGSMRPSRKALAAHQIFQVEEHSSVDKVSPSATSVAREDKPSAVPSDNIHAIPSEGPSRSAFSFDSPRPTRRATVLGSSPEKSRSLDINVNMTPSKRKEKSKSANDLKRLIRPISKVQLELDKLAAKSGRATILDRDLFTPDPTPVDADTSESSNDHVSSHSFSGSNSLTDSPFLVQPYPARKQALASSAIDSPTQRQLEGVYDRFLMATSGVKRVGKGYQSCTVKPVSINVPPPPLPKNSGRFFHSTRRPMPPPVSSEDRFMTMMTASNVVDELGVMTQSAAGSGGVVHVDSDSTGREDRAGTAKTVSRALKALVTGKTVVKKASSRRMH